MIFLGVTVAACILLFGIATYIDTYFVGDPRKNQLRLGIIKLFVWIDNTHASNILLVLGRALSGWVATIIYFFASALSLSYEMYLLALGVKKDVTDGSLPHGYEWFQQFIIDHYSELAIYIVILLLPNTICITLLIKIFIDKLRYNNKVAVWAVIVFIAYVLFITVGAEYVSDLIDNSLPNLIRDGHIFVVALLAAASIILDALDILDDLDDAWIVVFFPAIAIGMISVATLAFLYIFKAIKWCANKFLGAASDYRTSPYTFFVATLGIIVSLLALVDEIHKLSVEMKVKACVHGNNKSAQNHENCQ